MNKVIVAVMLLLGLSTIVFSCSKVSTDDYNMSIVGKWQLTSAVEDGRTISADEVLDGSMTMTFLNTGEFTAEEIDGGIVDASVGTYWIEGKTLFLRTGRYTESALIEKLTDKELVLIVSGGDFERMSFKRVG